MRLRIILSVAALLPSPPEALALHEAVLTRDVPLRQVLADVIASGAVPVARLTEVFRQAAESGSSPTPIGSIEASCRS